MSDWVVYIIERGGYGGIFFLMVLENLFPPIPSEVILPLAGFAAAKGDLHIVAVIVVGAFGAAAGCLPWYALGRVFDSARLQRLAARYGRWFVFSSGDIATAETWFARHGRAATLFGRLVPTVRTLISVPAGMARMPFQVFLLYSFCGGALWTGALALLGYWLEQRSAVVSEYVGGIADGIIVLIAAVYAYRVVTFRPEARPEAHDE